MSGIFGVYYPDDRPLDRATLEGMSASLEHRGRDGHGLWMGASIGLGHRMTWITPESVEEQLPAATARGDLAITSDARIDNRDELIAQLGLGDRPASTIADSEIIVAAYARWGESCPVHLIGDFVFAIWDASERKLFLARDPFGAKHFCYYHVPATKFLFASEVKALLRTGEVPREINELSVADHLVPTFDDKASTFFKDVWRLPAGHCLVVDRHGSRLRQYYAPDFEAELRLGSDAEYAEAFREHFVEAVRCRMRSAFPIGSTLSGGLDSSSITCTARNLLEASGMLPLHTFSSVWPSLVEVDPKVDERRFMDAVTSADGIVPHYIHADAYTPLTFLDRINWHTDGALGAPNVYATWATLELARDAGVRVLFHGTDGDSTVSYGYEDLREFVRRGWWRTLYRESRALAKNMPCGFHRPKRLLWKEAVRPVLPEYVPEFAKDARSAISRRPRALDWKARAYKRSARRPFNADFATRTDIHDRFVALTGEATAENTSPREQHWLGISSGMFSYLLETFEKIGGPFSAEFVYPFFDRRLVEFCIALPPGQRLKDGWTRSILRRAMEGILPPSVQWRPGKGNLSANVRLLLKREERELDDIFLGDASVLESYVDVPALRAMYTRLKLEPILDHDDSYFILLVANLHRWLRQAAPSALVN